jgi:hypothetical protein
MAFNLYLTTVETGPVSTTCTLSLLSSPVGGNVVGFVEYVSVSVFSRSLQSAAWSLVTVSEPPVDPLLWVRLVLEVRSIESVCFLVDFELLVDSNKLGIYVSVWGSFDA